MGVLNVCLHECICLCPLMHAYLACVDWSSSFIVHFFLVSEGMRHPCCWLGSSKSDSPSFDPTFLIHKEHEFGYQFCHRTEDEKLDHMMNHLSLYGKYGKNEIPNPFYFDWVIFFF